MGTAGPPTPPGAEQGRHGLVRRAETALTARAIPDLVLTYRTAPAAPWASTRHAVLVATHPDATGAVEVAVVTAVRQMVDTRPGVGEPELEALRVAARRAGVIAVSGVYRTPEPVAGDLPEFEVTILEPNQTDEEGDRLWPADQRYLTELEEIAALVAEWVETLTRRRPAGPRDARDRRRLAALAAARSAATAAVDWSRVAELQAEGRLGDAWRLAGIAPAFDPDDPDPRVESLPDRPEPATIPVAERVMRGWRRAASTPSST